jgi:hypothetical protein
MERSHDEGHVPRDSTNVAGAVVEDSCRRRRRGRRSHSQARGASGVAQEFRITAAKLQEEAE